MDFYSYWSKKGLNTNEVTFFNVDLSTCLHIMRRENWVFIGDTQGNWAVRDAEGHWAAVSLMDAEDWEKELVKMEPV